MHVERVESWNAAAALRDEWNRLAGDVPFRRWEWLGAWWEHYGAPGDGYVLAVRRRDGRLTGLAPWRRRHAVAFGNVVQFLGSGEACTDYLSVLCAEEDRDDVTRALARWLLDACETNGSDAWDMLNLDGVASDDPALALLLMHLEQAGCVVHLRSEVSSWRIPLSPTWDEYRSGLSKPNRRRVRVLQERLVETGQVSVRVASTREELDRGWAVLVDLHQRRRHELGQPGCFASPQFAAFARQAADAFLAQGGLEMLWVEQNEQPFAAQLGFVGNGATFAYQVGINPDKRQDSPGWLVHSESIKRAIRLGHTGFDFLRGDEPYKHHLGAQGHPLLTVCVVPPRLGLKMLHSAWVTSGAVKNWIKSGLHYSGLR